MPSLFLSFSDQRVRELARQILDRPRYANFRLSNYDPFHLLAKLRDVLDWLRDLYDSDPVMYWVMLVGLCALSALMTVYIVSSMRRALSARAPQVDRPEVRRDRDFLKEARELAAHDRYLEAAHLLLLANLRTLAENRHIALHPNDGNRAICRKLTTSRLPAALRDQLITLIEQTEQAWFGGRREDDDAADHAAGQALYRRWNVVNDHLSKVTAP